MNKSRKKANFNGAKGILEISRRLHAKNMLAGADGNISYRISDEEILITPSGINKAFLRPSDLAVITIDNRVLRGHPSSERLMHLEIYRSCPLARAVAHAHPPAAIAWSLAHPRMKEFPAGVISEVILSAGRIPIIPYVRPSTQDMGTALRPHLPSCRLMILSRHGAVSWGESLDEAYNGMERVEHSALILQMAEFLGGYTALPASEVHALRAMRAKLGEKIL